MPGDANDFDVTWRDVIPRISNAMTSYDENKLSKQKISLFWFVLLVCFDTMATLNLLPPELCSSSQESDLGDEELSKMLEESEPTTTKKYELEA